MKKYIKQVFWLFFASLVACSPQEDDKYSLGTLDSVSGAGITFTATPTAKSNNEIVFTNTSEVKVPYSISWDLGNGSKSTSQSVTSQYPEKGEYTVTLTLYSADGSSVSKSQVMTFAEDDFSLIDTPAYRNLTGGMEDADGKTWVFDQYNNFAGEVAQATGLNIKGHMGLGPQGSNGQEWWGAGPDEKKTWKMYDFKFTFVQQGARLRIQNAGEGYGRNASAATVGGFSVSSVDGADAFFPYGGGNYNFSIDESGTYPSLKLAGNAFMGYYCGSQLYDIIYQTDKVMCLRVNNTTESQDWVFVYCLEELNVAEPPVVKVLKAVSLSDDFESATPKINFVSEDMGDKTSASYSNPAPVPINTSSKVFIYQKSTGFYSNISWTAPDYLFDLTKQNKIKILVFIPGYNDYTTENAPAGDWISEKRLRPQVAVKLQDSSKGGNAWETQTEIVKKDLELGKWIALEFDFSSVSGRKDYDKIVVQFGGEGHSGEGVFFFDNFQFTE